MIKKHKLKPRSEEWHNHRRNFINASEVATVLGLSEYEAPVSLFAKKVGYMSPFLDDNKNMYWGRAKESLIAEAWQYYEQGDAESYVKNYEESKIIRQVKNSFSCWVNTKYPWLSFTPDRIIPKGEKDLFGQILSKDSPLELKTINAYVIQKWEQGIPPGYLAQVYCQAIVMEADYGELCMLDSNNNLHVYPVKIEEEFKQMIITETEKFWQNVLAGRMVYGLIQNGKTEEIRNNAQAELDKMEPISVDHPAYEDFYKEKYKSNFEEKTMQGTQELFEIAVRYKQLGVEIKAKEDAKQVEKNKILAILNGSSKADFGEGKYITYMKNKKDFFTLNVKVD